MADLYLQRNGESIAGAEGTEEGKRAVRVGKWFEENEERCEQEDDWRLPTSVSKWEEDRYYEKKIKDYIKYDEVLTMQHISRT